MKTYFQITSLFMVLFFSVSIATQATEVSTISKILNYKDLEAIAEASIAAEADHVNEELAKGNFNIPGYDSGYFKFFENQMGKVDVKKRFLIDKCILHDDNIQAILSKDLDLPNDAVTPQMNAVKNLKTNYCPKIWKMISKICESSQSRFTERIKNLKSNGEFLPLDDKTVSKLSDLVFYPTYFGKPSFKQFLAKSIEYLISGALIIGSATSLVGAPFAGFVISAAVISSSSIGIKTSAFHTENYLERFDLSLVDLKSQLKIDMTPEELSFKTKTLP